jgi:streptogramin lyase
MKRNVIFFSISLIVIFSMLAGLTTSTAQTPQSPTQPEVDLGEPGLSYRYVQTYGETQVPYFADANHLNSPVGLFMDGSDNLYVTEDWGYRVLKYDPTPNNVLVLGQAGVSAGMLGWSEDLFYSPKDVALDNIGNVWVADNNRVVQYDPSGVYLQQLPDDPWNSGDDNTHFNDVEGIAFDTDGRMFVSDANNQRVQVYDLTSGSPVYSTTLGITGIPGGDNGHFNQPWRIALDSLNQLYVADSGNGRVQQCTYAGGWSCVPLDSGLNYPRGLTVDGSNNVYIADTDNSRIRKCTSGTCADFATGTPGFTDLAVDSGGNIYGTVPWNVYTVFKYDSSGLLVGPYIGEQGVPYLTDDYHYNLPLVSTDAEDNILITEELGHRLTKLDPDGNFLWSFGVPGVTGWDDTHLNSPMRVAADSSGNIYVPDRWACRVQIISPAGDYLNTLGIGCGSGDYEFWAPTGVAIDNLGNVYVADNGNQRLMIYDPVLDFIGQIGETGVCSADNDHLCGPSSVALDSAGNIYVTDSGNNRVQVFDSSRVWQMTIGIGSQGSQFDQFASPEDITVDALGRIYVSDAWNLRVQVFDSANAYLTTIGGSQGTGSAQFLNASSVALNGAGNLYVSDIDNSRIQVYAPGVPGWKQVNINGFGKMTTNGITALENFNGQLYAGASNWVDGGQVWRTSDGTTWTPVSEVGFTSTMTITNRVIIDLVEFKSQLYAGTGWGGFPGQIWRSSDGTGWQQVVGDGFGNPDNGSITTFTVFSDTLYAAAGNVDDGLEIWRSSTGDSLSWTPVITGGLGYTANQNITGFTLFDGFLYIAIEGTQPCQVWRSADGSILDPITTDGFGDPDNLSMSGWATLDGYLYIGTRNEVTGAQLWRSSNGTDWDPVVQDGFGDLNNVKIESLFTFDGYLFAATQNNMTGMEVMRSGDGSSWSQVSLDGFGDSNTFATLWSDATIAFQNHMYIGTWNNANGGEIWMILRQVYLPIVTR